MATLNSTNSDAYAWIGASGGSWDTPADWTDTTAQTDPAINVPGTLTPVTIAGSMGSSTLAIVDDGDAASVGLTGTVNLAGTYAIGGMLAVGSVAVVPGLPPTTTLAAGTLELSSQGTISAGTVDVSDGTLSLDAGTQITAAGSVTIGLPSGDAVPYNGGFATTTGASGSIDLASGATLSAGGDLLVNAGTLENEGGLVRLGGTLNVGTATTSLATPSEVRVEEGGTLTVGGGLSELNGDILVGGAGSTLVTSGTLVATGGGNTDFYIFSDLIDSALYSGDLAVLDGGFAQLGGLVLNTSPAVNNLSPAGITVDNTSTIEIGTTGGAAAGAITIDSGRTITSSTTASFSGNLVDNGILAITGGLLTQTGDISGSGTIQIGADATWLLDGTIAATDTISMLGTNAVLSIGSVVTHSGTSTVSTPDTVGATIIGFQVGDSLVLAQPVSAATYTAGTAGNPGTLVLGDGTGTIETLLLTGNFTGENFTVSPGAGATSNVTIQAPPSITGLLAHQPGSDNAASAPFAAIAVSDAVPNAALNASILLTSDGSATDTNGLLSGTGLRRTGIGTYTLAATDAGTLKAELRALMFTPTDHQVAPGFSVITNFALTVADGGATTNANTSIAAIAQDTTAGVTPLPASQVAAYGANVTPFGGIAVTDPDFEAATSATIVLTNDGSPSDANGALTGNGLTKIGAGTYSLTATTPVSLSAELQALTFTATGAGAAPGSQVTTGFNVAVVAEGAKTTNASTSVTFTTPDQEFDVTYYLKENPDIAAAGVDPLTHYEDYGWKEGRNPDPYFNTTYYLNQNPDVAATGIDPLIHYEEYGWKEGRDPSIDFSTSKYLQANPDVVAADVDPLYHFLQYGAPEGRMAFMAQPNAVGPQNPLVDNSYYFSQYADVAAAGVDPFAHYDGSGWHEGRNPDALFNTSYYLAQNPDVKAAGVDPLIHYEGFGWKEGRDPSARFLHDKIPERKSRREGCRHRSLGPLRVVWENRGTGDLSCIAQAAATGPEEAGSAKPDEGACRPAGPAARRPQCLSGCRYRQRRCNPLP